jgi:hypothetical protein
MFCSVDLSAETLGAVIRVRRPTAAPRYCCWRDRLGRLERGLNAGLEEPADRSADAINQAIVLELEDGHAFVPLRSATPR